ncbi:helix-turn-helix domain-containing protein [Enterobacter asburiae]|uniref:helix-turn-helix domain-containing protein n=2 Tax=Enterobacter asburiae TaxID=61645 RepID=UPI001E64E916|nr:helix-turn-helix transcriptional regulator [Enterobacter asburiae]MCH4305037.1 helix-turn-helix domain-containing protein [Enterobacter asburiae]
MMKTSFLTILAFHIRDLREARGLTQAEIAEKLGMTSAGWGKIENGKSSLSVENLMKFCKIAGVGVNETISLAERSARELLRKGWAVSYSPVEDDNLMEGKNLVSATSYKIDSVMRKVIEKEMGNIVDTDFHSNIMKYASVYMSLINIVPTKFK